MPLPDDAEARAIISALGLAPHPEGGWYRETWRGAADDGQRGHGTAILFLLAAPERSHWHVVDADELWHFHGGAPLVLRTSADGTRVDSTDVLGMDLSSGERPQRLVPAGVWQSAETTGPWTLVGATVSPAFVFDGFRLAPPGWSPGDGSPSPTEIEG